MLTGTHRTTPTDIFRAPFFSWYLYFIAKPEAWVSSYVYIQLDRKMAQDRHNATKKAHRYSAVSLRLLSCNVSVMRCFPSILLLSVEKKNGAGSKGVLYCKPDFFYITL